MKRMLWLLPAAFLLAACSLAEDVTPPPQLATAQSQPPTATPAPPTATPASSPTARQAEATAEGAEPTPLETQEPAQETPAVSIGRVVGQVVNGTDGELAPEGLEVTLRGFDGQQEVVTLTATTDDEGRFVFEDVEGVPGRLFVVTAEYQDVVYGSEVAHFGEQEVLELPLQIYESTQSTETLQVDRLHLVMEAPAEGVLRVIELWIFSNLGDRTIQGAEDAPALEIALPAGATGLQFEGGALGDRFVSTEKGFADRSPIRPGSSVHQLVFSFELPYEGKLDFSQPIDFPVTAVVAITPAEGPELKADSLMDQGVQEISGMSVRTYQAGPYEPGGALEFKVRGKPWRAAVGEEGGGRQGLAIGLGALGVAALAAALWLYRSGRAEAEDEPAPDADEELAPDADEELAVGADEDAEAIVARIAALDDAFEAGELEEADYRAQRQALKDQLKELLSGGDD